MSGSEAIATLIGDIVNSRRSADRATMHHRVERALREQNDRAPAITPLAITAGDEFQGSYRTVGQALDAALRVRLAALPHTDLRFGIGWGDVTVLDAERTIQDGPGWWAARAAIEAAELAQRTPATAHIRTAYRSAPEAVGPDVHAVNAALLTRDHLLGTLDDRSRRILEGLMQGETKAALAEREGVSASAISQRTKAGIDLLVLACAELEQVG